MASFDEPGRTDTRFALSGASLPGADDLFGVWEVRAVPSQGEGLAFDASAPAAPAEPIWRVQLPASPEDAQAILDVQSLALQRSESDLWQAQQRLARVSEGVSFDVTARPEAELWAALNAIEAPASFGPSWREDSPQREIYRQWRAFLEQVRRLVSHYARIETEVGGMPVGHTAIDWTGDFDTLWETGLALPVMHLHHQAVHLALASRIALLRLLIVVGTGAARLALRLTVPGAQVLLLPAVWKFVRDVLKELRQSWPQIQTLLR